MSVRFNQNKGGGIRNNSAISVIVAKVFRLGRSLRGECRSHKELSGNIRNWRQLHRYCIQYASFEDGTNLNISAISMPTTTSRLHCGFLFLADGQLEAVTWTDLEFHCLGDDGTPVNKFTVVGCGHSRRRCWTGGSSTSARAGTPRSMSVTSATGSMAWKDTASANGNMNTDGTEPQNNMWLTC
ncbi:hypothetical protein MAR_017982 [Mya arenaria]|uniref:Uncharacterized protein n=1 Tax=Mya arenaria TaxID=6604 RepID=A0ABY7EFU2_MYAAR|nr:hypothetical protein MAR_017982 [Mya arenaria]